MTRLALSLVAFTTALEVVMAVAVPALFAWLLRLPTAETQTVKLATGLYVGLGFLSAAALVGHGLAKIDRPSETALARARVLALPGRLAASALLAAVVPLLVLVLRLRALGAATPLTIGVFLCTAALLLLLPVPIHAYARVTLLPTTLRLGDESRPARRGFSLGVQLGYAVLTVSAATMVPAAVFGAAQLDVASAGDARERAERSGRRLAQAARDLPVAQATRLLTRTPLESGERTLLEAPSGTLMPEEDVDELMGQPYVAVPLGGALRGGALRLYHATQPIAHAPLLLVTLFLLLCAALAGALAGWLVARDVAGVAAQVERVIANQPPGDPPLLATAELRRLILAANRLLERVPRFTVESFLAIERAEDAQRLKARFLANMSHDLRSPLNSILGYSELLLRGVEGSITPQQAAELEQIYFRGHHLLRLLNEILDAAKMESGKMELHRQSAPPAELVRAAVQEARRGRRPVPEDMLDIALEPGLPLVYADPLRVTQAFTHLVHYALDVTEARAQKTPAGKAGPKLRFRLGRDKGADHDKLLVFELELETALDSDEAAHLFADFRKVAGRPGLQLALPLARRLLEQHGGTLSLKRPAPLTLRGTLPLAPPLV